MADGNDTQLQFTEKDLRQWDLLAAFRQALAGRSAPAQLHPSWSDERRKCGYGDYLSLYLFGLFNPAIKTMRSLCAASDLSRGRCF